MLDPSMMQNSGMVDVAPPPPPMLHDVKIVRRQTIGRARAMAVPPEEFSVSRRTKLGALQDTDYCHHKTVRTVTDLLEDGFDEDSVEALPAADFDDTEEAQARDTVSDRSSGTGGASNLNKATRQVEVTEHYIRMRYESDEAALYRVTTAGESTTVLYRDGKPAIDRIEEIPFASMTPFIMTHRFFGRSLADLVMDIQRIKTSIIRQLLDNMYLTNNQRTEIAEEYSTARTIDDWLTNRPGGIVRTRRPGGLNPIPNNPIGSFGFPLLEYWDQEKEERTGVTRQGQGLGEASLKNVGEQALLSMFNMAQQKMRLIARVFAETGIRDLFLLLHAITRRNATKADTVRLRRKWVTIDPSKWRRRDDMTVTVGLGSGSKGQQVAFLTNLLGLQKEALAAGGIGGMVQPKHVYNTVKRLVEASGFRSVDPFAADPEAPETQQAAQGQQQDPKMMEAQAKLTLEAEKAKAQGELDQAKAEHQARLDRAKLESDINLRREQMNAEIGLAREKMNAEIALRREQMDKEAQTRLGVAAVDGLSKASESDGVSDVRMGGEVG